MTYTFSLRYQARTMSGNHVIIPDQVVEAQKAFDRKAFPVLRKDGRRARAILRGDQYGLWTPGTGDVAVSMA